jgi:hypothetical protein
LSRRTISFRDFLSLRSGDLVVWRGKYLRTITKGPADEPGRPLLPSHGAVHFAIRHRSWTGRIYTVYSYNDLRDKIAPAGKRTRGLILPSEYETLETAGFNVRRELRRELKWAEDYAKRGGRLCAAYPRLAKLIRGKAARP